MFKHLLFILILVGGGYFYWTTRPVTYGPGVVAPKEPEQIHAFGMKPIEFKAYKLTPLAEFSMEVRVLSKKRYYEDNESDIAPYDFVVGWGPMSDERNLDQILIKQSDRSFYWETTKFPIPQQEMRHHIADIHMVPSDKEIRDKLGDVRQGHIIRVSGYLVNIKSPKGWELKTSLSRTDGGDTAGEVLYIKQFEIL